MSRSRYIWVVIADEDEGDDPIAAFTVKHEVRAWLDREPRGLVGVCRITDNGVFHHERVWLNPDTLEPAI